MDVQGTSVVSWGIVLAKDRGIPKMDGFIMENPMNKWRGESPLFSETSKKGIRFGNIWFQGFTFIVVDPKPTDRCLGAPTVERTTSSSRRPDCISSWTRIMKLAQILSTCSWWLDWWVVILIGKAVIFQEDSQGTKGETSWQKLI